MNEQSTSSRPGRVSSATSLSPSTSRLGSSYIKSWSTSQACMDLEQGPVLEDGEHSGHHCHLCHGDSVGVQLVRSRPALPQVHRMCLDGSEPNPGWGTEAKDVLCSSYFYVVFISYFGRLCPCLSVSALHACLSLPRLMCHRDFVPSKFFHGLLINRLGLPNHIKGGFYLKYSVCFGNWRGWNFTTFYKVSQNKLIFNSNGY